LHIRGVSIFNNNVTSENGKNENENYDSASGGIGKIQRRIKREKFRQEMKILINKYRLYHHDKYVYFRSWALST